MRRIIIPAALVAGLAFGAFGGPTQAGTFRDLVRKIVKKTHVPVSVSVRNETDQAIMVTLDGGRDQFVVAPHGRGVSRKANLGDNPTLRVLNPATGEVLYGHTLGVLGTGGASLGWNGKSF